MKYPTLYHTVQIDGLSIFYREAGPKDAPMLLLLHGLPSSSRMFEPLFARLSDRYHLVAPDYPGFGHSDWPDPKEVRVHVRSLCRDDESLHRSAWALALYALHAGLRRPRGLSHSIGPSGPDRGTHRPGRCSAQRRPGTRIGRHGELFGPIAQPTKARFAQISFRSRRRGRAMSGTIPTWNAMTRIYGPMNLPFSTSPARPTFKATSSTTTAPTSRPTPNGCGEQCLLASPVGVSAFEQRLKIHQRQRAIHLTQVTATGSGIACRICRTARVAGFSADCGRFNTFAARRVAVFT